MFYFCFCVVVVVVVVVVYYNLKYWVSKAGVLLMAGYQQSSATCKTLIKTLIRWLCCLQFLHYRMQGDMIRIIV